MWSADLRREAPACCGHVLRGKGVNSRNLSHCGSQKHSHHSQTALQHKGRDGTCALLSVSRSIPPDTLESVVRSFDSWSCFRGAAWKLLGVRVPEGTASKCPMRSTSTLKTNSCTAELANTRDVPAGLDEATGQEDLKTQQARPPCSEHRLIFHLCRNAMGISGKHRGSCMSAVLRRSHGACTPGIYDVGTGMVHESMVAEVDSESPSAPACEWCFRRASMQ